MSTFNPSLTDISAALSAGGPRAQMAVVALRAAQQSQELMAQIVVDAAKQAAEAAKARGGVDIKV
jgi:hypothetical protein